LGNSLSIDDLAIVDAVLSNVNPKSFTSQTLQFSSIHNPMIAHLKPQDLTVLIAERMCFICVSLSTGFPAQS
jgi:hypothetical protein